MNQPVERLGRPLRVAVVGAGVMGMHHAGIYATLPQAELVAVVDPDLCRRHDVARQFGVGSYPDIASLLASLSVDAASVAAPTSLHYPLTKTLLEAGVHVLVEKPVATLVAQAEHLAALSRRLGLVLQVGHITRFYRAVQYLSAHVRAPYLIEARRLTPNARIKDVGAVLDLMIHDLDIVLGLVQSPVASMSVHGHVLNGSPFEDVAAAQIVFADGCVARFLASRVAPDSERSLLIAEPDKTLRLDFAKEPHTEISVHRPSPRGAQPGAVQRIVVHEDNPLRHELEHFLSRIRGFEAPIGTLHDDLRALKLATRLLEQLERPPAPPVLSESVR